VATSEQAGAGGVGEVAVRVVEAAAADGAREAVFVGGEELVEQPCGDAESACRARRGQVVVAEVLVDVVEGGLEQPTVPAGGGAGRLGLLQRDGEQAGGVRRQPGGRARCELAAVDGEKGVADGCADTGDGADPGRGRHGLVQVGQQRIASSFCADSNLIPTQAATL
jgi:hypothetical protein